MSKIIVVIFPDEAKAHEGVRALKELHAEGPVAVYAGAMVVKDSDGTARVEEKAGKARFGTMVGGILGGLIGLVGGPPVAAVGAASGAVVGGWRDVLDLGVGFDFVDEVSRELTPGKSAIIAEVDEDWVTPLDTRMEALDGIVLREWRDDLEDERIRRMVEARKAELARLETERAQAAKGREPKLKARVDEARAKLRDASNRAAARMDRLREETEMKIGTLQDQAAEAKADAKKIDRRIAEIRADHDRRSDKLKQARELANEALAP